MLLAKQGVNVNQAADNGGTPLSIASQNGHAEVVSMLLAKQGVDVNQAKNDGATPLYIASQKGHAEVVSMLLATEDIDVNRAWKRNERELVTPLRAAIDRSHTEIAKLLVIRGSILVDAPTGAHGIQLNLVLGAFAQACKADFDALCVFRLCLVRAYHDDPPAVEGAPSPAQRRRIARHRMGSERIVRRAPHREFPRALPPRHLSARSGGASHFEHRPLISPAAAHDVQRRK